MTNEEIKISFIPTEELNQIKTDLAEIKESLRKKKEEDFAESYIDSKSIPKLLKISQKTWQTYRDKRKIPFIQFGSKIWVKRTDLENFLDKYYIKQKSA